MQFNYSNMNSFVTELICLVFRAWKNIDLHLGPQKQMNQFFKEPRNPLVTATNSYMTSLRTLVTLLPAKHLKSAY